jgi:hypothetical protein
MVDLRKSLLLLVAFAVFASVAFAQPTSLGTTCVTTAVNPTLRLEGITELIGDVVLQCTGGTPTTPGQEVPRVNIVLNAPRTITSKLLASTSTYGDYTEALLLVDEPTVSGNRASVGTYSGVQRPCPTDGSFQQALNYCVIYAPNDTAVQDVNNTIPDANNDNIPDVAPLPSQAATYDGTSGHPNIFQGRLSNSFNQAFPSALENATAVGFFGVPFDPPGTNWTRTLRITNVRIDATQLAAGQSVAVSVSISGPQSISITNPVLTAGLVQQALEFSTAGSSTFRQCEPPIGYCPSFQVQFRELIPAAFKLRQTDANIQAEPGQILDTESGFWNPNFGTQANRGDLGEAGHATHATRLIARFANIPSGIQIYTTTTGQRAAGIGPIQAIQMDPVSVSEVTGEGPWDTASPVGTTGECSNNIAGLNWSGYDLESVPIVDGATGATWEITTADPNNLQTLAFGVTVRYQSGTIPEVSDSATVEGHFAPLSDIHVAAYGYGEGLSGNGRSTASVPRFRESEPNAQGGLFEVVRCETNLLFPFVTNYPANFDTGFAVSNTSMDPFAGSREQEGPCHIYYYGTMDNDPANDLPPVDDTATVPSGKFITWSLSGGGANPDYLIDAAAGFAGYVIVKCDFQYAHGYAFISDLGATQFAQGYVALVMDASLYRWDNGNYDEPLTRTGVRSENLDQ